MARAVSALKENVAAGVLVRAGWPDMAAAGAEFFDPMCGSGTFVIEAALIAAGIASGLGREYFGFLGWRQHDAQLWQRLLDAASANVRDTEEMTLVIRGHDRDAIAIKAARANAQRAGVDAIVRFAVQPLAEARPSKAAKDAAESAAAAETGALAPVGLVCVNPPYGVRLEDHTRARAIHRELGEILKASFEGWQAAVLTGAPDLGLELGLRAHRVHTVWNGSIECRLLRIKVEAKAEKTLIVADKGAVRIDSALKETPGAQMFGNRLGKNLKQLSKWLKQTGITCYRAYDADMPEYAFAIDSYQVIGEEKQPPLPEPQTWLRPGIRSPRDHQ